MESDPPPWLTDNVQRLRRANNELRIQWHEMRSAVDRQASALSLISRALLEADGVTILPEDPAEWPQVIRDLSARATLWQRLAHKWKAKRYGVIAIARQAQADALRSKRRAFEAEAALEMYKQLPQ